MIHSWRLTGIGNLESRGGMILMTLHETITHWMQVVGDQLGWSTLDILRIWVVFSQQLRLPTDLASSFVIRQFCLVKLQNTKVVKLQNRIATVGDCISGYPILMKQPTSRNHPYTAFFQESSEDSVDSSSIWDLTVLLSLSFLTEINTKSMVFLRF